LRVSKFILLLFILTISGAQSFAADDEWVLDSSGRSISIPSHVGKKVTFRVMRPVVGQSLTLYYENRPLSTAIDGIKALPTGKEVFASCTAPPETDMCVTIPVVKKDALFYYVVADRTGITAMPADPATRDNEKAVVAERAAVVRGLSDAIKAYAGMDSQPAADALGALIKRLEPAESDLREASKNLARATADYNKKDKEYKDNLPYASSSAVLRIGVIPTANLPHNKPVYYNFVESENLEQPFRLERLGNFPVFTVHDNLYLIVVNHRRDKDPSDFVLSFGTEKASLVDIAPVRPTIDPSKVFKDAPPKATGPDFDYAYLDHVLPFANKLPGETIPIVTVSSYAKLVTTNKEEDISGEVTTTVITETKTAKLLESERWPQVHSLFHFNISTGIVWTALRDPSYSRVLHELAKPQMGSTEAVPAKYVTSFDRGSPRALPILAFAAYLIPQDVQVLWRPKDLLPAPTVAFSLQNPGDDFFLGLSSEIRRNVQLLYGYHYGRVTTSGPTGADDPTSSAAPVTTSRFKGNAFVGLTFNVNFIKDLFK